MKGIKYLFLILAISLLIACRQNDIHESSLTVDGNVTQLRFRNSSPENIDAATAHIKKILEQQRAQSHAWKPSELSRINNALAKGQVAPITADNIDLLTLSQPLYLASDGYYDPGIGSLVKRWGFYTDKFPVNSAPPTYQQISEWLTQRPSFSNIHIEQEKISSTHPDARLDFSTILKGVAAKKIRALVHEDALISMGADVFSIGDSNSKPWPVLVKDPFGGDLAQVELRANEALFTSGNFTKFHIAPTGSRWGHILNPHTGKPAQGSAAVVVLHSNPVLADAASTALMAAGPGKFNHLVQRMQLACALMVTEENELLITTQMKKRTVFFRDPVPLGPPIDNGLSCGEAIATQRKN